MSFKPEKTDFAYNSQLDAFELYHLVIEDDKRPSHRNGGPVLPALGHALSGSVATATSKLLIYPLDLVIARLQVQKQLRSPKASSAQTEYKGLVDAAGKIYQHEGGLSAFYTGCLTDISKGIADSFLFFLAYSYLQQRQMKKLPPGQKQMTVVQEMGIGIVSGAFSKLITTPLQNIITRQQTAALAIAHNTDSDGLLKKGDRLTIADIARQIHNERGLAGFWTGYSLSLILTLNPAITFAVDNFMQKSFRAQDTGASITFLVAAISKAIATTITYPVSVAKARAQAKPFDRNEVRQSSKLSQLFAAQYSVLLSIRNIYKQDGISGLYSGIEAEVLKGFLSHGLTMMMKDRVHHGIIELYYLLLKMTSNWPADLAAQREAMSEMASDVASEASSQVDNIVQAEKNMVNRVGTALSDAGKAVVDRAEVVGAATYDAGKSVVDRAEAVGAATYGAGKAIVDRAAAFTSETGKNAVVRVQDAATTTYGAGKDAISQAQDAATATYEAGKGATLRTVQSAENAGSAVYETGQSVVGDVSQRVDNISTTVVEAAKSTLVGGARGASDIGSSMIDSGKQALSGVSSAGATIVSSGGDALGDVAERAENIGTTTYEASKNVTSGISHQAQSITGSTIQAGSNLVADASTRVENVAVSAYEAGKNVAAAASEQVSKTVSSTAEQVGNSVSSTVEQAGNTGSNVIKQLGDTGRSAADQMSNASSNTAKVFEQAGGYAAEIARNATSSAQRGVEDVGETLIEAGKVRLPDTK